MTYTLLDLVKDIDKDNYANKIDLESITPYIDSFKNYVGNSALRKVYDSYLDISEKNNYEVEKQIWIARLAYQEKRKLLPFGFAKSLKIAEERLNNKELFKKFLEVLVAYHKYLGGKD